jgi:hypothetical protein
MGGILTHALAGLVGGYILALIFPKVITFFPTIEAYYIVNIIFALLPDLPYLFTGHTMAPKPILNIFWFHAFIDTTIKNVTMFI